jgi:hypothetical protein
MIRSTRSKNFQAMHACSGISDAYVRGDPRSTRCEVIGSHCTNGIQSSLRIRPDAAARLKLPVRWYANRFRISSATRAAASSEDEGERVRAMALDDHDRGGAARQQAAHRRVWLQVFELHCFEPTPVYSPTRRLCNTARYGCPVTGRLAPTAAGQARPKHPAPVWLTIYDVRRGSARFRRCSAGILAGLAGPVGCLGRPQGP